MALFSKDTLEYFETVFEQPITSWDEAYKLWAVVPHNQKDVKYSSDIMEFSDNHAIIHWQVSRFLITSHKNQFIDGIFEILLNDSNLCTYFKQWRSVKE